MDQIDSRPQADEVAAYVPQKMYQPIAAWIIFGIVTLAAVFYILVQGRLAEDAIANTADNAQAASNLTQPVRRSGVVNGFDDCIAAGFPVMESDPEQCMTPDGQLFINGS